MKFKNMPKKTVSVRWWLAMVAFVDGESCVLINWSKDYKNNKSPEEQKYQVMVDFTNYVIEHRTEVRPENYVPDMSKYIYFDDENEFIEAMNEIADYCLNNDFDDFTISPY